MGEGESAGPSAGWGAAPRWVTIAATARMFGVSERAVRRRVERGSLESRREEEGNRVRTLVRVDPPHSDLYDSAEPDATPGAEQGTAAVRVARLEERLAAAEETKAELRRQVDQVRADLERERQRAEASERRLDDVLRELREERRRPWPGLRRWWRRFVEGER